jgi:hypothetical protein
LFAGWVIVRQFLADFRLMFRLALSWIIGSGIAGTVYFATLSLFDSRTISLVASEASLIAIILAFSILKGNRSVDQVHLHSESKPSPGGKIAGIAFVLTALLAGAAFLFISDYSRQGGWDAIAIWNLKARFIVRSDSAPVDRIVDPALTDTHPDYPMLLPSIVARAWQYAGVDSTTISEGIAGLFTFSTFAVAFYTISILRGRSRAFLLGCILLSTPFFLVHGASQYADVVLACFMVATVSMFCMWDSGIRPRCLPLLAGLFAGFAACTKNEGIMFLLVAFTTRVFLSAIRKTYKEGAGELAQFAVGAMPGFVALVLFKLMHSPPNDVAGQATLGLLISRAQDSLNHITIWKNFLREIYNFGSWWIYPIPVMILYLIASRMTTRAQKSSSPWSMPALVLLGMSAGFYTVYLVTPHALQWHLETSLARLMLQMWPTGLVLYFLLLPEAD